MQQKANKRNASSGLTENFQWNEDIPPDSVQQNARLMSVTVFAKMTRWCGTLGKEELIQNLESEELRLAVDLNLPARTRHSK